MYHYQELASGQLIQQETLTQLAILVDARDSLLSLRAMTVVQMMQHILT